MEGHLKLGRMSLYFQIQTYKNEARSNANFLKTFHYSPGYKIFQGHLVTSALMSPGGLELPLPTLILYILTPPPPISMGKSLLVCLRLPTPWSLVNRLQVSCPSSYWDPNHRFSRFSGFVRSS